jgi:cell division protease FtsH
MITEESKKEIIVRKKELEKARKQLKKEFVGLDSIIDEIIEQVRSWYIFPDGQVRPSIVNLWGMTGVGKTSLVRRLFDILDMSENFFKFDMGEYTSGDLKIKDDFSDKVKNLEDQPVIIVFDEFQIGRTIDEMGMEIDRKNLRVIWDLLDTGKFDVLNSSWYGKEVYLLYFKILKFIHEDNIKVKNGIITESGEEHAKMFFEIGTKFLTYDEAMLKVTGKSKVVTPEPEVVEESTSDTTKKKKKKKNKEKAVDEDKKIQYLIPTNLHWVIKSFWEDRFISNYEFLNFIRSLDAEGTVQFLSDTCDRAMKPKLYDFSNSIIFVIGNLDSVYSMSRESNPDVDADSFHENSLDITQTEIKQALQGRFRIEQIARLGNNHIIYPAFSSKIYQDLIVLELGKLNDKIQKKFDLTFDFDPSVNEIIYKEGVFPTQGVRPVFTTISSIIESYIGKFISLLIEKNMIDNVDSIKWSYKENEHILEFYDDNIDLLLRQTYPVNLKVESLRESTDDDNQAFTAVHEAGHAVAMMVAMKIVPKMIRSKTANTSEGFCASQMPEIHSKVVLEDRIAISVAGRVAEQVIFGEDRISTGASGDIATATETAMKMLKFLGMNASGDMIIYSRTENNNDRVANSSTEKVNQEAITLITRQKNRVVEILNREKVLLLKMAEYLTSHSFIDEEKAIEFYKLYGSDSELEFLDQKHYYPYKNIMLQELKKIEAVSKLDLSYK